MTRTAVCTAEQVLQTAGFSSQDEVGGSAVVTEAIEEAETEVSNAYGNPAKKSTFILDSTVTRYEFRVDDKKTYRVDRVILRDDNNNRITYTAGTASQTGLQYTEDLEFNTITFHADTVSTWNGRRIEVDYVPIEVHHLTRLKAALFLIENSSAINAGDSTPARVTRLLDRIKRIEDAIMPFIAVGSEDNKIFDPTYGEVIPQRRFWVY